MPLYPPKLEYSWGPTDRALLAQNMPLELMTGNTVSATAGRLEFARIRLPVAASVTNVVMNIQTIGVTLTAGQCFAVLYTAAGARVGVTADQAATWAGTTGVKAMALASGPFVCAAGDYYVAWWYNGTTAPAWLRSAQIGTTTVNLGTSSPNFLWGFADTGLTTTSPSTIGAMTFSNTPWWVALS